MKSIRKLISILLIVSILATSLPAQMFADITNSDTLQPVLVGPDPFKIKEGNILSEVIEKREKNIKQFFKDNETTVAAIYSTSVHYKVDGQWKDIDNRLTPSKDENNKDIVENKANQYKIKIAKNSKTDKLVRIQNSGYELSWNFQNTLETSALIESEDVSISNLSNNDKKTFLPNLISNVTFKEIFPNVDLEYLVRPDDVKENIILKNKIENVKFVLSLRSNGLVAKIQEDKSIAFFDVKDLKKQVFIIEPLYMIDAAGALSTNVEMILETVQDGYNLTIIPDNAWISDTSRVYPIKIDPTVRTTSDELQIKDTHVTSNLASATNQTSPTLIVGKDVNTGINRSFIQFPLPSLTSADMVVDSQLNLNLNRPNSAAKTQVDLIKMRSAWDSATLNWTSAQTLYNSSIDKDKDYQIVDSAASVGTDYKWDITPLVKEWYVSGNNNGVILKAHDENLTGTVAFDSSDIADQLAANRPYATITYVNYSGLEQYWTYHSISAGRAGSGYVNDYNGNLVFIHNDISTPGNLMPINLYHVFNSNSKNTNISYGNGWRLNINQTIEKKAIESVIYYLYADEDGTVHYFEDNGSTSIYDNSGLNIELIKNSDGTLTIKDKMDNTLKFEQLVTGTEKYYLKTITDNRENTNTLAYNGTNVISITENVKDRPADNRTVNLNYNSTTGLLETIVDIKSNRTVTFVYTNGNLTSITYPDNKTTTYVYNSGNLENAINFDGYKSVFSYFTTSPYRVKSILETHTDGTVGQGITINYGANSTTFTNNKAIVTKAIQETYQFNDYGNTLSIKNNFGQAKTFMYDNTIKNINKVTQSSSLQDNVSNYLKNHDIEQSGDWTASNTADSTGTASITTEEKYLALQSLKIYKTNLLGLHTYQQGVNLVKGKTYTLSAYVKTEAVTKGNSKGAQLYIAYQDSAGVWTKIGSKYLEGDNDWTRLELTFTVPANAYSNVTGQTDLTVVHSKVALDGETGTAFFDSIQLEDGNVANRYNIVENADFTYSSGTPSSPLFWGRTNLDSNDVSTTLTSDSTYPFGLDNNTFKFAGVAGDGSGTTATGRKYIYQHLNLSGTDSDVFTLGGWAKGNSAPRGSFAITVGVTPSSTTDTAVRWMTAYFNKDTPDWQYSSLRIAPDVDYKKITIFITYYYNLNEAYFDGIQLYKEEIGQSYKYDSNTGNLTKETNKDGSYAEYAYNGTNDVAQYKDAKQTIDYNNYEYHNLLESSTKEQIKQTFSYDKYGNTVQVVTGNNDPAKGTVFFTETMPYYTDDGRYLKSLITTSKNTVTYGFNTITGVLDTFGDGKAQITNYSHDPITDELKEVYTTVNGQRASNSYEYNNDRLAKIVQNGTNYIFGYDSLGNVKTFNIGMQNILTNIYDTSNGILKEVQFGNNQTNSFEYDDLGRIIEGKYKYIDTNNNTVVATRYKNTYDSIGNLRIHEDLNNAVTFRYGYDQGLSLSKISDSNGNETNFKYDANSNLTDLSQTINNNIYLSKYQYDTDNRQTVVTLNGSAGNINYDYDVLGRLKSITRKISDSVKYVTEIKYKDVFNWNGRTTLLIDRIINKDVITSTDSLGNATEKTLKTTTTIYGYDNNDNIEKIEEIVDEVVNGTLSSTTTVKTYLYDELNEIKEETKAVNGETKEKVTYSYDVAGNIKTKTTDSYTNGVINSNSVTYSYDNLNWKDLLTSYNGITQNYDSIGNLVNDGVYSYKWEEGKRLATMSKAGQNISFKYNADGIRTEKTVNGITTRYNLLGDLVTYETNGTDKIYYSYDANNNLVSMNLNGTEYYYIRNGQDDIIGLVDTIGTQVVTYNYDSWGKLTSIDGTMKDTLGIKNPYRYRGYRYDNETGLYYLQMRYYNPNLGRYINADDVLAQTGDILSTNTFAYAKNNPVNMTDTNGNFAWWIIGGGIGVVAGGITGAIISYRATGKVNWKYVAGGALAGGLIGAGLGYLAQPITVYGAALSYKISEFANDWIAKGFHIKIDGIELSMKPGTNGSIVFKTVFSSTPVKAGEKAISKAYELLKNPTVRQDFLNAAIKGRDYLKTFGTKAATAKSGELNFLVKALQKYGR